jgi:hypothetical protein
LKTAVYNVRLNILALATIHQHLSKLGIAPNSISGLTRQVIEGYADSIIEKELSTEFSTTSEAKKYFEEIGMLKPLKKAAIIKGLQKEAMKADGINPSYAQRKSKATINPDQYDAARKALGIIIEEKDSGAILGPTPGTTKKEEKLK